MSKFESINTRYRNPSIDELSEYILDVLKKTNSTCLKRTKKENLAAFEKGWQENFRAIKEKGLALDNLKPKYFRESKFFRFANRLIVPENRNLEYDLFTLARLIIFNKYLRPFDSIYEIGCGSCQNLLLLSQLYPDKELHGLDWTHASVKIANFIGKTLRKNIQGHIFDMFKPKNKIAFSPGSAIFTIHALEQIGNNFDKIISFILHSRPGIVVHYEPIMEFYNDNNLLDYTALLYSSKRNYLQGYFTALCSLERKRKIRIIEARRPYLGGIIHEASLIIWEPV